MNGYLRAVDESNRNKGVLIADGDIVFYEDINGVSTPVTAITQMDLYTIKSGVPLTPPNRYKSTDGGPQVFTQPKRVKTFASAAVYADQKIDITTPTVSATGNSGEYQISISGGLKTQEASGVMIPLTASIRGRGYSDAAQTWVFSAPNISAAEVWGSCKGFVLNAYVGNSKYRYTGCTFYLRVGVGASSSGPDVWGGYNTVSFADAATHDIGASISGVSGNYLFVQVSVASYSSFEGVAKWPVGDGIDLVLLGARVNVTSNILSDNADYDCVVCGR